MWPPAGDGRSDRRWTRLVCLLALVGVAMPGPVRSRIAAQPVGAAQRDATVPFRVGESLTYDVTWSSILVAGTAVASVVGREPSGTASAYRIVAEGRPVPLLEKLYRLYYRMESMLDSVTLLPHRSLLYSEEGDSKRTAITSFDRATRLAAFEVQTETAQTVRLPVPQQTQDGLSAVYILRTMALGAGESFTVPIIDSGVVYSVRASVVGAERLTVPLGEFDAWSLTVTITDEQGQPAAENAALWISNDARRLPLKLQATLPVGSFVLLLREAR